MKSCSGFFVTGAGRSGTASLHRYRAAMRPETRGKLLEIDRKEIERLQGMTGRDLSAWLR